MVISLLPGESGQAEGLRYQVYKNRYAELTGLTQTRLKARCLSARRLGVQLFGLRPRLAGLRKVSSPTVKKSIGLLGLCGDRHRMAERLYA